MVLPETFLKRVRELPSATVVHIPVDQRQRHAVIVTQLLNGIADGDASAAALEEGRSRLLLGPPLRGANLRVELATRLHLWESHSFEELLVRAEVQSQARARQCCHGGTGTPQEARGRRARSLIAEGEYSKAASSLHTDLFFLCLPVIQPQNDPGYAFSGMLKNARQMQ